MPTLRHATTRWRLLAALAVALGAVGLLAAVAARPATASAASTAAATGPITGGTVGIPQTWATGIPGGDTEGTSGKITNGDTWYNTWADDGNIYATSDDSNGFNGTCSNNFTVNELTGNNPSQLASPFTNCMTSYGGEGAQQDYNDGYTWKTDGIISVSGTLYVAVARQQDATGGWPNGLQPSADASIIKSTDHGRTWSNSFGTTDDPNGAVPPPSPSGHGAEAMFPGSTFATPEFIQYGQDDNLASTADGGDKYVYAISNNGYAYDGSYMILGRVLQSQIGDLNAADWQYYTGAPGEDGMNSANWSSDVTKATHILTAPHRLSQSGVQYDQALHEYIMTSFYYPFVQSFMNFGTAKGGAASQSNWDFYEAPHPWGPWTRFFDERTTQCYFSCDPSNASDLGLYDPDLVSKFIHMDGLSNVIFSTGDFNAVNHPNDYMYRLHAFPFTLTTAHQQVIDDMTALPVGATGWGVTHAGAGYYDNTYHVSSTPGGSVTYTFYGNSIAWVGAKNTNHGYAQVSIDGGPPATVDGYAPQLENQQIIYEKGGLSNGKHTITVTVTANKNPASTGLNQDIDAFIVGR